MKNLDRLFRNMNSSEVREVVLTEEYWNRVNTNK